MNIQHRTALFLCLGLIAAVTLAAFLPSLGNDFVDWDDDVMIHDNPKVTCLSWKSVAETFISSDYGLYHPFVILSYALEYKFFGPEPRVYHTSNLALHILNSLLVFFLVYLLSGRIFIALAAGLLFGVHPIHVESVAWASERKDVLYAPFFVGALISYLSYLRTDRKKYYYLTLLLFVLSLFAKPMALSLPLVMILMDFYLYTKNFGVGVNKKSWREKIPFFLLAVAFGVVALLAKRATGHLTVPEPPFSIANFFIGSFRLVFYYLPRLFFMFNFTRLHPHNSYVYEIGAAIKLPLIYWLSPFILAALLAGSVFVFRKNRPALFGLLFFLVTFSPVLPLVAVGIFADRYLYIPSLGIFYLMGMGAWRFYQKLESRGKILSRLWIGLLVLACGFSASLTWQKCGVWKNSITLYDEACRWYPSVAAAFQHRGLLYFDRYENEKALMDFNRSLELDPEFADAFNSRGNLFARLGMLERAISDYRRAVNMKPEDVTARTNLGFLLSEVGKNQEAIMVLNQAIELKPDSMEAYHNRGNAYMQLKKYDRALADYNRALQISPDAALTYFNRSQVFFMRGAYRRALQDVEKARSLGFNVDPSVIKMLREKLGGK